MHVGTSKNIVDESSRSFTEAQDCTKGRGYLNFADASASYNKVGAEILEATHP